jgi:hypothetical protein
VHAPSDEKRFDSKDSFCEELEQVFDHFPKSHVTISLGFLHDKMEKEDILKPTIRSEVYIRKATVILLE